MRIGIEVEVIMRSLERMGAEGAATVAQSAMLGNGRKVSPNCDNPSPENVFGGEIPAIDKALTPSYLSLISSAAPRGTFFVARLPVARKVLQFQNALVCGSAAAASPMVRPGAAPNPARDA